MALFHHPGIVARVVSTVPTVGPELSTHIALRHLRPRMLVARLWQAEQSFTSDIPSD